MTELRDPLRLSEESDAAFAEIAPGLRDARAQAPSAVQFARMRAALGLPSAEAAPSSDIARTDAPVRAGATRAARFARPTLWIKVVSLVAFGAGLGFLAAHELRSKPPEPAVSVPPPAPARSASAAPAAESKPESAPAHAVEPAPVVTTPARAPAPSSTARRVASAIEADVPAELALLKRAKAHAQSAPERALSLLAEHERRFEHGAFVQEREVIAIEALIAAGRRSAAEQRAARFLDRFRESAHARRVRALLVSDTNRSAVPHPVE